MKKLYVDGLGIVEAHFSGVGQYILGILRGLDNVLAAQKAAGQKTRKIIVIIPQDAVERFQGFGFKHLSYKTFPASTGKMLALWHHNKLPPMDLLYGRGIYLFPRFVGMRLAFSKSVLVIYDLSFELHKEFVEDNNARFLSGAVGRSVKKASRIIAISESSRREVVDFYHIPNDKVGVATPATDPKLISRRSAKEIAAAKKKYGIEGEYILALSNLEPRKNLEGLVEAYLALPVADRKKYSLLIVGADGWKAEKLFSKIDAGSKQAGRIIRPREYVLDADKAAVISGASLLVYPSHYEGFGMPPLEALACGVPVITANNSSLPEVVGDAGTMVNSHDQHELSAALADHLKHIEKITKLARVKGPEQAAKFSWEASARVFLDAIDKLD